MLNKYTFIFEIVWRDPQTGHFAPREYRKKTQMSINDARVFARRLTNTANVLYVSFFKEMH